ncbi:plasma membrane ATPase 4 [Ceratobasidium sp. AG-Ba]|nr:plasma membrane ATPase 4 [Ceratobasidium sp. AG-Ba]
MDAHQGRGNLKFERMGLFDVDPFWRDYPHVRVDCLMTPDLLHQLHKGVMKDHLTKWVTEILGKQIIDKRYLTMPEYHGMRHFKNGITSVSQWTGRELKEMAKILLPVVSDQDEKVVKAARALLDFMYLAHSSALTDSKLEVMVWCKEDVPEFCQIPAPAAGIWRFLAIPAPAPAPAAGMPEFRRNSGTVQVFQECRNSGIGHFQNYMYHIVQ